MAGGATGTAGSSTNGTGGSGAAGSSISGTRGIVVPRVGSPGRRYPAYEQVEGPPLLEPVE